MPRRRGLKKIKNILLPLNNVTRFLILNSFIKRNIIIYCRAQEIRNNINNMQNNYGNDIKKIINLVNFQKMCEIITQIPQIFGQHENARFG